VAWGVWLQQLGSFFLRTKKKIHCANDARASNGLRRLEAQGAASLKKRLPVLPTARRRARDMGSVVAISIYNTPSDGFVID
jgi:hypothetical protein